MDWSKRKAFWAPHGSTFRTPHLQRQFLVHLLWRDPGHRECCLTSMEVMVMVFHVLAKWYAYDGSQGDHGKSIGPRIRVKIFRRISDDASRERFMDHKILRHPTLLQAWKAGEGDPDTKLENYPGFGCYAKLLCKPPKAGLYMIWWINFTTTNYYLSIFSNEVYSNSGTRVCIWPAGIFQGFVCAIGKRSFGQGLLEGKFIYQGSDVPTIIYYGILGDKCQLTQWTSKTNFAKGVIIIFARLRLLTEKDHIGWSHN